MLVKISVFMILDDFKESGVNSKAPSIAIMFPFAVYFLKTENNRKKFQKTNPSILSSWKLNLYLYLYLHYCLLFLLLLSFLKLSFLHFLTWTSSLAAHGHLIVHSLHYLISILLPPATKFGFCPLHLVFTFLLDREILLSIK